MSRELDLDDVARRLSADQAVRRGVPVWGRLHVDRKLPFLCVYRRPADREDAGTERLVVGEAAYLRATAKWDGLPGLLQTVVAASAPAFGAFLVIELWSGPPRRGDTRPTFRVLAARPEAPAAEALAATLSGQSVADQSLDVELVGADDVAPPGLAPLGPDVLGLEVPPIYRNASGVVLPAVFRALHRIVARALKQACFVFAKEQTTHRPIHWHAMGRRAVTRAVWTADRRTAEVAGELDFMLMVTPVNVDKAWRAFRRSGQDEPPVFRYRPWPGDPADLLRRLYNVPVRRIEDPTLRDLFEEKRIHLGRKVAMLRDRGTPEFRYGSLQVYGGVDDALLGEAMGLLDTSPPAPGAARGARCGLRPSPSWRARSWRPIAPHTPGSRRR